jgi:hypothetical protein
MCKLRGPSPETETVTNGWLWAVLLYLERNRKQISGSIFIVEGPEFQKRKNWAYKSRGF